MVANEVVSGMVLSRSGGTWGARGAGYFVGDLCLVQFFFLLYQQHSNHVFPRFNHSSIVNYVIKNR